MDRVLRRLKLGFGGSGRPSVAFLSTGALSKEYRDVALARESIVSDLVLFKENADIVFVTATKADLPETVSRLYKSGVRYFIGGITSTELLSISPLFVDLLNQERTSFAGGSSYCTTKP